jgi:sugar phosphate isomerase/epimerase
MKLSAISDMLFLDSLEEALQTMQKLGFRYVDLRDKLDGDTVDSLGTGKAKEIRKMLDHYGLQACVLVSRAIYPISHFGPHRYNKYDEQYHAFTLREFDRLCDTAEILGASCIRINTLYRTRNYFKLPDHEKEEQQTHNAEALRKLAEHGAKRGVIALVENEPPSLANKAEEFAILLEKVNHPNLRINWDIVNQWRAGTYPTVADYELIKGSLGGTHLKGAYRVPGSETVQNPSGVYRNVAIPDIDDFDHMPLLKAIAKHDPDAIMTIDTHFHELDPADKQWGAVEVMRRSKKFFEAMLA